MNYSFFLKIFISQLNPVHINMIRSTEELEQFVKESSTRIYFKNLLMLQEIMYK